MECRNNRRCCPSRPKPHRKNSYRLRHSRKLAKQWQSLRGQELQHLQFVAEALGAVLGGQRGRKYFLLRRPEQRRRDGLLHRRTSSTGRLEAQAPPAVLPARPRQSPPVQPRLHRRRQNLVGRVRLHLSPEEMTRVTATHPLLRSMDTSPSGKSSA